MGIRPCITFPRPPLKFRTAGFPQYGFKPVVGGNLRPHAGLYAAQASSALAHNSPSRAIAALRRRRGELRPNAPAQRPLARQRVVLSRRVNAYYGLIRASRSSRRLIVLRPPGLCLGGQGREGPWFELRVFRSVPSPIPRWTGWPWLL